MKCPICRNRLEIVNQTVRVLCDRLNLECQFCSDLISMTVDVPTGYEYEPDGEDGTVQIYSYGNERAVELLDIIKESVHQSFDGWGTYERSIIIGYLNDLHLGLESS